MTNLFTQIAQLVPRLHGWATPEKCQMLAASVITLRPEISVIIGVWGGRDTFAMGLAHKELGRGRVIGIDPWVAVASVVGQDNANRDWWQSANHEIVYRDFLEKRGELGLNDVVSVQRMISDYFEPPKRIGLLVIDGNHGPQAGRDVDRYAPNVPVGGLCLMDDIGWEGGHVKRASANLCTMGFVSLYEVDSSIMYQRISR